jgi:glucoamylase
MTLDNDAEYRSKIERMILTSKKVIKDSLLDNGAIVAANATKEYYPPTAKNYFYVWPRDASYACIAADIAGIGEMQEKFFNWCLTRAEGFEKTGLLYEKYYVNGLKALSRFQPDQTGILLYAIWHHYNNYKNKKPDKIEELVANSANALCDKWENDHFNMVTNDLWEERLTFPDLNENFTYSLAACISGLECANSMNHDDNWIKVSKQMREQLDKHYLNLNNVDKDRPDDPSEKEIQRYKGYFVRSYGKLIDKSIDASILGLVYPFMVYEPDDPRIISTVEEIEARLIIKEGITRGGVHRYEFDEYDGWMHEEMHRKKGAGAWPLLNLWLSIYFSQRGDKYKAKEYYEWVLSQSNEYIPEQIFDNKIQVSIRPLLWSHSMFIIASKFLWESLKII